MDSVKEYRNLRDPNGFLTEDAEELYSRIYDRLEKFIFDAGNKIPMIYDFNSFDIMQLVVLASTQIAREKHRLSQN